MVTNDADRGANVSYDTDGTPDLFVTAGADVVDDDNNDDGVVVVPVIVAIIKITQTTLIGSSV